MQKFRVFIAAASAALLLAGSFADRVNAQAKRIKDLTPVTQTNSGDVVPVDNNSLGLRGISPDNFLKEHLVALKALTTAADKCVYYSGADTPATYDCKSWIRSVIAAADASAGRTAFGLAIGTNVQAWDADLDAIASAGLASGAATFLGTSTSANLRALLTDETGTGAAVFADSPALAGNPTAPTQTLGNNSTRVATTAFVQGTVAAATAGVASFGSRTGIVTVPGGSFAADAVELVRYDASQSLTSGQKLQARANTGALSQTLLTPQATTSGTDKDFTIPTGAKSFTVAWHGVSASSTGLTYIQLGDAGGIEASGYLGSVGQIVNAGASAVINGTTAIFIQPATTAANVIHGSIRFTLVNSTNNTWVASGTSGNSDAAANQTIAYSKSLSQELTTVRFGVSSGSFDAGEVNVLYESP